MLPVPWIIGNLISPHSISLFSRKKLIFFVLIPISCNCQAFSNHPSIYVLAIQKDSSNLAAIFINPFYPNINDLATNFLAKHPFHNFSLSICCAIPAYRFLVTFRRIDSCQTNFLTVDGNIIRIDNPAFATDKIRARFITK